MRKYIILCHNHIIKRGISEFYTNVKDLVPIGYRFTQAFNCLNLLTVNTEPSLEIVPATDAKQPVDMKKWGNINKNLYRMEM